MAKLQVVDKHGPLYLVDGVLLSNAAVIMLCVCVCVWHSLRNDVVGKVIVYSGCDKLLGVE